ncbi:MAG: response regulator [Alphaproteobacteria bacterium]|nr:response regulator [Alphaproteobacteria bacterium]
MAQILLIDDDDVRRMLVNMLVADGHEVHEASNGDAGIALYDKVLPELVITDILMPDKDGIETIMALKRNHPDLKILAISGGGRSGTMDFLDMARALGADETLQKPFRRAELLNAVVRLIGA